MSNIFFKSVKSTNEKNIYFSLLLIVLFSFNLFSQEKSIVKYTVAKGETITLIAQKYKITPYDIYKLNPDSQKGVKENDIILIPISSQSITSTTVEVPKPKTTTNKPLTHIVKAKETFYSIARDYNVNVDDLKKSNKKEFQEGLKIGETIIIPSQSESNIAVSEVKNDKTYNSEPKNVATSKTNSEEIIYHIVEPKETKFGISKKYGITVEELEHRNPEIVNNLPVGYKLIISGNGSKTDVPKKEVLKPKPVVQEIQVTEIEKTDKVYSVKKSGYANYEVKPKETLYSLSEMFNISQEELIQLNPTLKDGVITGMILKVPGNGSIVRVNNDDDKEFTNLSTSINTKTRKELVLLIPFNANKIQADTLKTLATKLKKDAFLNMTLDYYSGVLMAIDSAKTIGLNIDVKIFDSEEKKLSSNVVNIVKNNNLQNADAIIGPFYQQNVEKVAELLDENKVPIISPLSKEIGKPYDHVYQSIPPSEVAKKELFNYMIANNGNIIVVVSPSKIAEKELITKKCPTAQFTTLNENGGLNPENFKSLFVKGKINYVILATEKTSLILEATNIMLNEYANYQLQLVILESNDTLDFEEISMKRLTILKMLYPSLTRENITPEAIAFRNSYKKKYKIFPSQFAIRGFDVTFDTMLRLSQNESFEESAKNEKSQQIESKFEYVKDDSNEYVNKGIYILQYVEDYTVKQVN